MAPDASARAPCDARWWWPQETLAIPMRSNKSSAASVSSRTTHNSRCDAPAIAVQPLSLHIHRRPIRRFLPWWSVCACCSWQLHRDVAARKPALGRNVGAQLADGEPRLGYARNRAHFVQFESSGADQARDDCEHPRAETSRRSTSGRRRAVEQRSGTSAARRPPCAVSSRVTLPRSHVHEMRCVPCAVAGAFGGGPQWGACR